MGKILEKAFLDKMCNIKFKRQNFIPYMRKKVSRNNTFEEYTPLSSLLLH